MLPIAKIVQRRSRRVSREGWMHWAGTENSQVDLGGWKSEVHKFRRPEMIFIRLFVFKVKMLNLISGALWHF